MPPAHQDAPEAAATLTAQRHSVAHLLAKAVLERFDGAVLGTGPATADGFFYDFDLPRSVTPDDVRALELRVKELVRANVAFEKEVVDLNEARQRFCGQPLKLELIDEIAAGRLDEEAGAAIAGTPVELAVYRCDGFEDLCRGPHVQSAAEIDADAIALLQVSGAYWRGDDQRPQLQRISGTVMGSKAELDRYFQQQEEARQRDHRALGEALDLFAFSPAIGKGLPLWLPNGTIVRDELEAWARDMERHHGYQRIATPHISKSELYRLSGHLPYYDDDLYAPMDIDGEEYYLKPMNCPHHHMVFKARRRSYRELPLRFTEYGTVYRYEKSGQLLGLMRVRGFTQNDAHIYCTRSQAKDEFLAVMALHRTYYEHLGIRDYHMVLALRDPANVRKYHGDEQMWADAERITRDAMDESEIPYVQELGGAAHYGPKVDFVLRSAAGREFAASTNQVDLYMPQRFDLTYDTNRGDKDHVVVLHRAPLGSHERFIAFLIEHFAGAFPTWLAPLQVMIVPVSGAHADFAIDAERQLTQAGVRANANLDDATMQSKIRHAEQQKIPYIAVIGRSEAAERTVAVRARGGLDMGTWPTTKFTAAVAQAIAARTMDLTLPKH